VVYASPCGPWDAFENDLELAGSEVDLRGSEVEHVISAAA